MKNKITVVIPTLNASSTISFTLANVSKYINNIIIVDADSKDNTVQIAKKYKVKIIKSLANRGKQLHIGALSSNNLIITFPCFSFKIITLSCAFSWLVKNKINKINNFFLIIFSFL